MQICNPRRTEDSELKRNNIQNDNGWELSKIEKKDLIENSYQPQTI